MKTHTITSKTSGKVYEVRKMRTADSFYEPTMHYRRAGDAEWRSLRVDTLAQARKELNG